MQQINEGAKTEYLKFLERDEREIMREELLKQINTELKKSLMKSMFKSNSIQMFGQENPESDRVIMATPGAGGKLEQVSDRPMLKTPDVNLFKGES